MSINLKIIVSIQPKPKKGLEETDLMMGEFHLQSFNPAEAEEGFRRRPYLTIYKSIVYAKNVL